MSKVLINSAAIRKHDFIDQDGDLNIVGDALVSVVDYKKGSSAIIYKTDNKEELLDNPFNSEDNGQFSFWVEPGIYKISCVTQTDNKKLQGEVIIDASNNSGSQLLFSVVQAKEMDLTGQSTVFCNSFRGNLGASTWALTDIVNKTKASTIVIFNDENEYGVFYDSAGNQFKLSSDVKSPIQLGGYNDVITDSDPNAPEVLEANKQAFKALEYFRGSQFVESGFWLLKEPIFIRPLTTFVGASKGNGSSGKLTSDFNAKNGATVFVPHSSFDMLNFKDADGDTFIINIEDFPQETPEPNPNLNRFNDGYAGGLKVGNFQINLADYNSANTRVSKIEALGGLREFRAYDSANLSDINILWHGEARAWKFDAEQNPLRLSQTNLSTGLFSLGDDIERTVECALIRRTQESQFIGMKILAAPQGTPRNAPCLIVEDCRAVDFYSPSFASVKDDDFVQTIANNRTCNNINYYSPTVENGVGTTQAFRFKGFNGNVVAQCSIKAPREEAPQSSTFLVCDEGCVAGDFDVGQRFVDIKVGSESNYIFSKDVYKINDNNPTGRNQVIASGNKNDRVETHKQPVRTWQSDQLSPFFELAAGSDPNALKKFRIAYDANDSVNFGASFRDLDTGFSWVFDPSGFLQSPSGFKTIDANSASVRQLSIASSNLTINGVQKTGGATGTANNTSTLTIVDGRITEIN